MKNLKLKIASILMLGLSPSAVLAQSAPPTPPITKFTDITALITSAVSWLFTIVLGLSALFFLYAAFLYLTSAGDPTKVAAAKNILVYSIIALVIALVAGGAVAFIKSFLGITT